MATEELCIGPEHQAASRVDLPVVIGGKEFTYSLIGLTSLRVTATGGRKVFVIFRDAFGPERALEQALMSFSGLPSQVANLDEGIFLILFALKIKRLEQDSGLDRRHPTLERLFRRIPEIYAYIRDSNVQLGRVVHNDRAA